MNTPRSIRTRKLFAILIAALMCATLVQAADLTLDELVVQDTGEFEGAVIVGDPLDIFPIPTNGLLLYYPFRDDEGTNITDYSGQNNHATAQNEASWTSSGRVDGGAFEFDGTNDYIHVGATGIGDVLGTSCWFYNPIALSKSSPAQFLLSFYFAAPSGPAGLVFGDESTWLGNEIISTRSPSSNWRTGYCDASASIEVGWHHLAVTFDGSRYDIWLDGDQVDNCSVGPPQVKWSSRIENIGAANQPASYFEGKVDEVLIYDRALSDIEIVDLYRRGFSAGDNAGLLTVGSIAAASNNTVTVHDTIRAEQGFIHVPESGDLTMGSFTNQP